GTPLLHAPSIGWEVEAEAFQGEESVARVAVSDAGAMSRMLLRIANPRRWSPDDPHLYDLKVRLRRGGKLVDEVTSYFGLREVKLRGGQFLLNGQPAYLKMVLDQGYWPESGMTAPTDEALRADVQFCKDFGFNAARKHQK